MLSFARDEVGKQKLFTNSKFRMIFVALIPVINHNAQIAFKRGQTMTTFGYARVSTDGQSLTSQDAELHASGCAKVYAEKISGARSDRPELAKVLKRLDTGDVLIVTRLHRLARSTRDLLNILDDIAKRGAGFKSLHDAWADTTSAHGRLMVTVLAGLAEFERELILARTSDGRARAKASARWCGVRAAGRPKRLANGEVQADVARSFNVSQATISRLAAA